jgi:hypothetical protein
MNKRLNLKRLVPAGLVSSAAGLAFLLPAGALSGTLAFYGYAYATHYPGTTLASGPDSGAESAVIERVFFEGTDTAAWYATFDGTSFSGATSLGGRITADPGAVANGTRTDLMVRGTDQGLYHNIFNGATWSGWTGLGGRLSTGPDASLRVGMSPTIVDVWVGGTDGQLYHKFSMDGGDTYGAWEALGGYLTSDPRAVSWSWGRVDVFARGTDYQLYHRWFNISGGWSDWEALGGTLNSAPDVASCATGHLDVFVRGTDNQIYNKNWNGSVWSAWTADGGTWTSSVSAVCRPGGGGIIDLFMRGTDSTLWTMTEPAH